MPFGIPNCEMQGTVSQNLKSHMNEGQRLNYILDRSLYNSKMIEGEKSIFYRPVF